MGPKARPARGHAVGATRASGSAGASRVGSPARVGSPGATRAPGSPAQRQPTGHGARPRSRHSIAASEAAERLKVEFRKADTNGDGVISLPEMKALLQALDPSLSATGAQQLFQAVDKNNNGSISFEEFVDFVSAPPAEPGSQHVEGVPWSESVPVPARYCKRGASIGGTDLRGISLSQINDLAKFLQTLLVRATILDWKNQRVVWSTVNMYNINESVVLPLTRPFKCSFVELVAEESQAPLWFISHWWGTPFRQTVSLLNFHAETRQLPLETPYWICTFANNQHDLSELAGSLQETPFVKAILSEQCVGTLTLLDKNVTTLQRIWCVLENYVSTTVAAEQSSKPAHLLDIAAWLEEGSGTWGGNPIPAKPTLRMDMGDGKMQEIVRDEHQTGGAFPQTVANRGVLIDVFEAAASRQEDKRNILHLIAGTPEDEWATTEPPDHCEAYDELNRNARKMFAVGALYAAAASGDVKHLRELVEWFPDQINDGISDGCTPVYAASWKNHVDAVRFLLSRTADPNITKHEGASAVFIATQGGHHEVVTELLKVRANPDLCREDGFGPVHMAVQQKDKACLQALLDANADLGAITGKGATALVLAAQLGDPDVVKALLSARADVNQTSAQGNTPYQVAKSQMVIKLLVNAKADIGAMVGAPATSTGLPNLGQARAKSRTSAQGSPADATVALPDLGRPKAKMKAKAKLAPFAHHMGGVPNLSGGIISMYQNLDDL